MAALLTVLAACATNSMDAHKLSELVGALTTIVVCNALSPPPNTSPPHDTQHFKVMLTLCYKAPLQTPQRTSIADATHQPRACHGIRHPTQHATSQPCSPHHAARTSTCADPCCCITNSWRPSHQRFGPSTAADTAAVSASITVCCAQQQGKGTTCWVVWPSHISARHGLMCCAP